jgi:hypothetical protein
MAARDIMPWRSPLGGTTVVQTYALLNNETFDEGEVVRIDSGTGQLEEAANNPDITIDVDTGAVGVAAEPAEGMAMDAAGDTNPGGAMRGVWQFTTDQEFITPNYAILDDAAVLYDVTACILTHVGTSVGLMLNTNVGNPGWGITSVATNEQFRITGILDARKQPIRTLAAATTAFVTFRREPTA